MDAYQVMRRVVVHTNTVKSIAPTMDAEWVDRPTVAALKVASETVYCMDDSDCLTMDSTVALDKFVETEDALAVDLPWLNSALILASMMYVSANAEVAHRMYQTACRNKLHHPLSNCIRTAFVKRLLVRLVEHGRMWRRPFDVRRRILMRHDRTGYTQPHTCRRGAVSASNQYKMDPCNRSSSIRCCLRVV